LANRARVLMRLRKWSDAVRDLKEAGVGAASPNEQRDVALAWDLGRALFLGGQIEESVQAHRQLLAQLEKANAGADPASPLQRAEKETLLLLAQLAYHQGDVTQAKKYVMQWYDSSHTQHARHTHDTHDTPTHRASCMQREEGRQLPGRLADDERPGPAHRGLHRGADRAPADPEAEQDAVSSSLRHASRSLADAGTLHTSSTRTSKAL
jgi:tetratricopeptide (TPR) repeat protein